MPEPEWTVSEPDENGRVTIIGTLTTPNGRNWECKGWVDKNLVPYAKSLQRKNFQLAWDNEQT